MEEHYILISGPTVSDDLELFKELKKTSTVLRNNNNCLVESIIKERNVDLIILELTTNDPTEAEIIKSIKIYDPNIEIITISRDRGVSATAFEYEANDVYRMPYRRHMIVQSVKTLKKRKYSPH